MAKEQLTPEEYEILFGEPPPESEPPEAVIDLRPEAPETVIDFTDNAPHVPFSFNGAGEVPQRFSLNDPSPITHIGSASRKRKPPTPPVNAPYSELPYVREPVTVTFDTNANEDDIAPDGAGPPSLSGEPWRPNRYMLVAAAIISALIAVGTFANLLDNPTEEVEVEVPSEVEERILEE